MWEEYVNQTKKTSTIARAIVAAIFFMQVHLKTPISSLIAIYFLLEMLQYTYLGIRAELTATNTVSIVTSNKLRYLGCLFYYSKMIAVLILLVRMI